MNPWMCRWRALPFARGVRPCGGSELGGGMDGCLLCTAAAAEKELPRGCSAVPDGGVSGRGLAADFVPLFTFLLFSLLWLALKSDVTVTTLCSVPITFLLVCNLGKLMLLHPAVKQMKYSCSLWYCSAVREGIRLCSERLSRGSTLFSGTPWAGWFLPPRCAGLQRGSWRQDWG